jgi:nucleolar complex protein 2
MSVDDFLDNMDFDADSDDNEVYEHPKMANGKSNKKLKTGKLTKSKTLTESSQDDEELPPIKQKAANKKAKKTKSKAAADSSQDEEEFELPASMKAKLDKALKKAEKKAKKFEVASDTDEAPAEESVKAKKEKKKKGDKKKAAVDTDSGIEEKAVKVKKKKAKKVKEEQQPQDSDESGDDTHDHNAALNNLKETDPEFYKFLENNDRKLLNFNVKSDGEEDSSEEDEVKNEKVHKPDADLQVASDESDFEAEDDDAGDEEAAGDDDDAESDDEGEAGPSPSGGKQIKITLKMLKDWERDLQVEDVTSGTIKTITVAFRSALQSITSEDITEKQAAIYRVEGAAIFNGIVQLCVLHLPAALLKFLKVSSLKLAKQSKRFKKIIGPMRSYLPDITKLLENATSTSILTVLLKHLHQLAPLMPFIFNLTKPILKRLIALWATAEDSVRVLSFLCILKITRAQQTKFLKDVLRIMYLNYVKNCKFVSPNTLPSINFMRRSLAEMFGLDMNASYNIVFMFVRQLAIHLRNAYTDRKKENVMAVYNWQYVNSLRLWGDVLALTHNKQQLQPLIYPFVTIVIGVIKLISSAQYYPARMHCCRILVGLAKRTNTFIPVLPFLLEVLKGEWEEVF